MTTAFLRAATAPHRDAATVTTVLILDQMSGPHTMWLSAKIAWCVRRVWSRARSTCSAVTPLAAGSRTNPAPTPGPGATVVSAAEQLKRQARTFAQPGRTPTVTAEQVEDVIVTTLEASPRNATHWVERREQAGHTVPDVVMGPLLRMPPPRSGSSMPARHLQLFTQSKVSVGGDLRRRLRPAHRDSSDVGSAASPAW